MINFHYCNAFIKAVENCQNNEQDNIYKKISDYSNRDSLSNINSINYVPTSQLYILRLHSPESRIIIQEKDITIMNSIEKVFFVRDIITNVKFDREYGRLLFGKIKRGEWIQNNPLSDEEIEKFSQNFKVKQKDVESCKLLEPPAELINWLNDFKLTLNNEIFESNNWVAYALENCEKIGMIDKYVYSFKQIINQVINQIFNQNDMRNIKLLLTQNNGINVYQYEKNNFGILFSLFNFQTKKYLLLLNGAHLISQKEYWEKSISKQLEESLNINSLEDLNRFSYRSYPKWTLQEDELWFRIEKSEENNNLSLTNEQIDFLKNFQFPCYINGRAGSGKSTLLYYGNF